MLPKYDARTLKRLRLERQWKHEDVARRAGITARTVMNLERGFSEPRANTLAAIAVAFECPMETFFRGTRKRDEAA